jgi:hypothetical protein
MFLFNIVHILQLVIFENMLAYKNVKSYIFCLLLMGLRKICEPKTPFKLEHGLHLGHKNTIKIK